MNKDELKKMLNAVYEMEGLIELALRRNMADNSSICRLIADKSYTIANMAAEWNLDDETEETLQVDSDDEKVVDVFVENCLPKVAEENTESTETQPIMEQPKEYVAADESTDEEVPESEETPTEEETESNDLAVAETIEDYTDVEDKAEAEIHLEESESQSVTTVIIPQTESSEPEESDFDDIKNSTLFDDDDFLETTDESEDDSADNETSDNEDDDLDDDSDDNQPVSDTELLTERKDIRGFFTVNDKFRFKRELFGNNNIEFTESLNLVQTMRSYDEAEDYFYNDLQWDPGSEDVIEFMNIIARFFK